MAPRPQRLVRRQPLMERLRAMLNPMDFYLWLSEEIQTFNWDSKTFGTRFGLVANFIFLVARANAGTTREAVDDVFGDAPANGWFTLMRNVEQAGPGTPSAQRVRVDSSPASSTPLRLLQGVLSPETAEERAHPDKTRDVWELKVWDPYPATLRMFCLFSPGHVLIHMLFLPLPMLDPRPSVTVFKCFFLQVILSAQLLLMHSRFSQQSTDTAVIQKEVMHEYDVKYVHPRLHPTVREASTQVSINDGKIEEEEITIGTPTTMIQRSFRTHPNPNYSRYVDPDAGKAPSARAAMSPQLKPMMPANPFTPSAKPRASVPPSFAAQVQQQRHSAVRRSLPPTTFTGTESAPPSTPSAASKTTTTTSTGTSTGIGTDTGANYNLPPNSGYGGSLGVYTHMNSPLKKATSLSDIGAGAGFNSPRNNREMAALEQRDLADRMIRQSSPFKEHRRPAGEQAQGLGQGQKLDFGGQVSSSGSSLAHSPEKLARARAGRWTQERFPSRRL
ncbi:hypothetical protein CHGG_04881 [Chaetomium globosum CBS 148.51]|uniref:Nuclear rim protein 1 n=1 Tax=Chaetomium globosum (strain ATCC 6205 / CBS 148.51 / DSM 1962 / NBRC 6347 / NRRL 1970) TaxID=306901 RepID=Q2H015_CHAGB|nr:uncharacterized protein CHGG_04881 [Chaetomium globosum CBS 148.51]EAQ88262.1 hypothetical protein CHGG_04881 [Chaetomium globosum CBS 148.51]